MVRSSQGLLNLLYHWWWLLLFVLILGGYWLLPIAGQVMIYPGVQVTSTLWPQITVSPAAPKPGDLVSVSVTDQVAWPYTLLTIAGQTVHLDHWQKQPGLPAWTWVWTFTLAEKGGSATRTEALFYTNCHTGCRERGKLHLNDATTSEPDETVLLHGKPTKLCVVFADPARNWHNRSGWTIDLTYARLADNQEDPY
jgi:hypothetical protein